MKVIVEQSDLLDALFAMVDPDPDLEVTKATLRRLIGESEPAPNQVRVFHPEPPERSAPAASQRKPLNAVADRLEELRAIHGPVYVLNTTADYQPRQIVTWSDKQVEIIEATPEEPRRWYGKVVEV